MLATAKDLLEKVEAFTSSNAEEIEAFRIEILGNKGELKKLFAEFKNVPPQEKKEFGVVLNELKQKANDKVTSLKNALDHSNTGQDSSIDYSRPTSLNSLGSRHPISIIKNEIIEIFNRIGFTVSEGPEIEDDWHNFSALNFPPEHPARDMQDNFFVEKDTDIALRNNNSYVQVRVMENSTPTIRNISTGRV